MTVDSRGRCNAVTQKEAPRQGWRFEVDCIFSFAFVQHSTLWRPGLWLLSAAITRTVKEQEVTRTKKCIPVICERHD